MEKIKNWVKEKSLQEVLEFSARYILYIFAALLPLWFIPLAIGADFGREITFSFLVLAAAILVLVRFLVKGEIRYGHSPLLYLGGALLIIWAASTFWGKAPLLATILNDVLAEKLTTLFLGFLLMVILGSIFKSKGEAGVFLFILIFSGGVAALFTLLQLFLGFSLWGLFADFARNSTFNVIGTTNGLSLFYASLWVTSLGIFLSLPWIRWRAWILGALLASNVFLGLAVLLINYRAAWITILGAGVFLFGLMFLRRANGGSEDSAVSPVKGGRTFGRRHLAVTALLALSIFMLMFQPTIKDFGLPAEVSPSFKTTWKVATSVFKEGPGEFLLGSGPASFGLLWDQYKDPAVNQTVFWNIRFNQGFSWVLTSLATAGILGALALVAFLVAGLFYFIRAMILPKSEIGGWGSESVFSAGALAGLLAIGVAAFIYPANFSLILVFFALAGVLNSLLSGETALVGSDPTRGEQGFALRTFWDGLRRVGRRMSILEERRVTLESQWAVFLFSLTVVFLLSLGLSAFYWQIQRFRAASAAEQGMALRESGDFTGAVERLERAINFDRKNVSYHNNLAQVRIERVRNVIGRAAGGENVQQEFQSEVNKAKETTQNAITLHPLEPILWRTRGTLYETIIPFIPGAESLAADSYRRSIDLGASNPASYVDFGRAGLVFVDTLVLRMNQVSAADRPALVELRRQSIEEVVRMLAKSLEVKPDFAPAHFLMSQAAIRAGDLAAAIRSTENAKLTAPFDVGVAFQLGLLYYQAGDFNRAQTEFERAVSFNENYSNARYFLGLIYDRRGDKQKAMEEFRRIAILNPDNVEVQRILNNLGQGRNALENIVPPAEPPEERKEPPVRTSN